MCVKQKQHMQSSHPFLLSMHKIKNLGHSFHSSPHSSDIVNGRKFFLFDAQLEDKMPWMWSCPFSLATVLQVEMEGQQCEQKWASDCLIFHQILSFQRWNKKHSKCFFQCMNTPAPEKERKTWATAGKVHIPCHTCLMAGSNDWIFTKFLLCFNAETKNRSWHHNLFCCQAHTKIRAKNKQSLPSSQYQFWCIANRWMPFASFLPQCDNPRQSLLHTPSCVVGDVKKGVSA